MRLNWFSPLPPAQTDIAHYTGRVLPALGRRAEVVLWTDQQEWDRSLETFAQVRSYRLPDLPWGELNRAEANVYHLGNNWLFHRSIWEMSRRQPGLVVPHDLCMQDFFQGVYHRSNDPQGYRTLMERHYGAVGARWAEAILAQQVQGECLVNYFPLTPAGVENALGVLVHTRQAFEVFRRADRWPVAWLPLPYPATPRAAPRPPFPERPPYRLVVFGYLGCNRRLEPLLRALASFPRRQHFRLDILGALDNRAGYESLIRELGLGDQATLHGFVPEEQLDAALESAHLAFNLRFPTMGEASGSQLRIWDHALPALVTRIGWYATLPQDTVAFVEQEREQADIHGHLHAFLARPADYHRLGANGRCFLQERHAPDDYAQDLLDFLAEVASQRSRRMAYCLAERVAGLAAESLGVPPGPGGVSARVVAAIHELLA
jgi:glycosyltransferase involved in cell wall biosynthesis